MARNGTILYAVSVRPLEDPRLMDAIYRSASPLRREKVDRLRKEQDKRRSLGAEWLLRYALRDAGFPPDAETVVDGSGKPRLKDGGLFFNLSHSGDYALCAVSAHEVGCDVEKIAPIDLGVAHRFFLPEECRDIGSRPTKAAREERFFRYWTLKESVLKATGRGMALPLNAFRILPGEPGSVLQDGHPLPYRLWEFDEISGYRCAVCVAEDDAPPVFRTLEIGQ